MKDVGFIVSGLFGTAICARPHTDTCARPNDRWIYVASHSTLTSPQENLLRLASHR